MPGASLSYIPYPSAFVPTSIPGCVLWMDAADPLGTGVAPTNGATVSSWIDKSGNGYNSPANTTGATFNTNVQNGYGALTFTSGQYYITPTLVLSSTNTPTVFLVCIQTGEGGGNSEIVVCGIGRALYLQLDLFQKNGTLRVDMYGNGSESGSIPISSPTFITLIGYGSPTYTATMWGNGTSNVTITGSSANPVSTPAQYLIGACSGFVGIIYEVLFYNTAFTTTQQQQVEGYLAWKWGLQANLPGGHPYASAAPTTPNSLGISRPAISLALAPTGVKSMGKASYYASFLPTSIAGCQLWYDAMDATTITQSSGLVSQLRDKSGNNRHISQATTGNQPSYANNTLTFNGSQYLTNTISSGISGNIFTGYIIYKPTSTIGNQRALFIIDNSSWIMIDNSVVAENANGIGAYTVTTISTTTPTIVAVTSASTYSLNGNAFINLSVAYNQGNPTSINLGSGTSGGVPFNGSIYEVLVYNTVLSLSQHYQVTGYLAWKWGTQTQLPTFTPTSISGCTMWLDATDLSTITLSGTSVTSFKDKSSNAVTFTTQGTASYLTVTAGINGLQSLYFNNTAAENVSISGTVPQSSTVNMFIVWQQIAQRAGNYRNIVGWQFSTDINPGAINYGYTATNAVGLWDTHTGNLSGSQSVTVSSNYIGFFSLPSPTISLNGATPTSTPVSYTSNAQTLYIGGVPANGQSVSMYLGEVIMYNNALTTTQRQQVEGYLATKWGLQSQLPSGHPYYTLPYSSLHPYASAAPTGANLRPALSQALVPAGVRGMAALRKLQSYTQTFSYTGANQTFPVPATTTSLTVHIWGAGGGGGHTGTQGATAGGAGAYVQGTLTVTPNNSLTIIVGGGGTHGSVGVAYGGGGSASSAGTYGGGGGRSAIQLSGTELVDAGGGGGAGYDCSGGYANFSPTINGGAGYPGLTGASWPFDSGAGGTQTAGGAGGPGNASSYGVASPGTYLAGGAAAPYAGGGGSGYYGGGGGNTNDTNGAGGGGGSSYTTNAAFILITGSNSSNGYSAPASASPYYASGVAAGSTNMTTGGNGRIVLVYLA